jgi:hypothetical protein
VSEKQFTHEQFDKMIEEALSEKPVVQNRRAILDRTLAMARRNNGQRQNQTRLPRTR